MKNQTMHMKVAFENRTYLLNRFPDSFNDLLDQVTDKVKTPLGNQPHFYFVDNDGDMIVVADNADLVNIKEVCKLEGKEVCKLIVDRPISTSQSSPGRDCGCSQQGASFDSVKYFDYLKKRLPEFSEEFVSCIEKGLPCEECLGIGKLKDLSKCYNCYGRGIRPMNNQFKLILQIIDFKFKQLLLDPLSAFVNGEFKLDGQSQGRLDKRIGLFKESGSSIEDTHRCDQKPQLPVTQSLGMTGDMEKTVGRLRTPSSPEDNLKPHIDD